MMTFKFGTGTYYVPAEKRTINAVPEGDCVREALTHNVYSYDELITERQHEQDELTEFMATLLQGYCDHTKCANCKISATCFSQTLDDRLDKTTATAIVISIVNFLQK